MSQRQLSFTAIARHASLKGTFSSLMWLTRVCPVLFDDTLAVQTFSDNPRQHFSSRRTEIFENYSDKEKREGSGLSPFL